METSELWTREDMAANVRRLIAAVGVYERTRDIAPQYAPRELQAAKNAQQDIINAYVAALAEIERMRAAESTAEQRQ